MHVVLVGPARRDPSDTWPSVPADQEPRMRIGDRLRQRRAILEPVVAPFEADPGFVLREQAMHDLDLFLEHADPLADGREDEPPLAVLALVPAGAHAELDPAARH